MVRSAEEFQAVQRLIAIGMNDCAIARQTGIPRRTVWEWRSKPTRVRSPSASSACGIDHDFSALPPSAYCYLFGLYLGDGCVSRHPRTWRLRIVLDAKYPGIIESCREAINLLMPGQRAATLLRSDRCTEVSLYSTHWPCLFPQHGPGKKHLRPIRLEEWQQVLVKQATEEFIRGLIDSDGCRVVAKDRGVRSVRYHFSNRSDDIRGLFCAALDDLGIPWTTPGKYQVAVYRKAAVARLDEFVGPKA
ncbi:MAG TPA: LAGLIDADG family homing endonuclease [Mycobacterium sp.]|uniref:LAGLIDADG family homing endonuclease n=1 Tax=Mycobacterium sp. TaxID=1785 RepID=UPI002D249A00|nr:LAGLIDADG family homing endonuclease [Mycobacterium sp.]HZU47663.1 LAGLIDADG family homing endonuclease [Mycobacterium sp.]